MNTASANAIDTPVVTGRIARLADRWIYVFMAGLFILTALSGFIPESVALVAAIRAHERPPLPSIFHVHAALMGSWLLLLFTQALLVATDRRSLHRKLGLVALFLVPLMLVTMVLMVRTSFQGAAVASAIAGADQADLSQARLAISTLLPEQFRAAMFFAGFTAWALWERNRDSETHKRLMVLATLMPLPAGIDRIHWLPSTMPASTDSSSLYMLLWLLPALIYDLVRRGRIHRAYLIGVGLNLPLVITAHLIVGTRWWLATAPRLIGVRW